MNNQTIIMSCIILCSLGGWYLVVTKYLAMKDALRKNTQKTTTPKTKPPGLPPLTENESYTHDIDYVSGEHIPGMGPPPIMPYRIPEELINSINQRNRESKPSMPNNTQTTQNATVHNSTEDNRTTQNKRQICNWASIMHISGLAFITGVPFLNIIVPTILWLLKKEQHPFLARQGREVINFQITFTLLQFLCLGLGTVAIWMFPNAIAHLFEWTRTMRIIFSTGMHFPFNCVTVIPFFWGCVMVIRGTVAAYHGINYKYPYAQPFVFEGKAVVKQEPQLHAKPESAAFSKISFG